MATRITRKDVESLAAEKGVLVCTWSPGDGMTRYRIFRDPVASQTYCGPRDADFTALGSREAYAYLSAL